MSLLGLVVWTMVHHSAGARAVAKPPQTAANSKVRFTARREPAPVTAKKEGTKVTRPEETSAPKTKSNETLVKTDARINMTLEEARLCDVNIDGGSAERMVSALVSQTRLNLVLLGTKTTPVTLRVRRIPLIDAVRHLCALSGMRFLRLPGTLVIGPDEMLKSAYPVAYLQQNPPPVVVPPPAVIAPPVVRAETQIVRLQYLPGEAVAATMKAIFGERGLVAVSTPNSTAPVLDTSGISGSSGGGTANTANGGGGTGLEIASRSLVLYGPPDLIAEAVSLLARLDVPRAQVRIEVTIHDINANDLKELGISWTFSPVSITESPERSFLFGKFDRTNLGFNAVIKALETNDRANLLASPNIMVQDGERSSILIGDRLTFPKVIGFTQANTPIFDTEEQRVGIYLQVGAQIADDGTVTMTLAPQVSTVTGFIEVNGGSYPQISTREAQTTVRVRSGEAIILGGLIRTQDFANMERVPILADIPILGELFKRRKRQKTSSELVISVTPTIVVP